jgi:hypothetical protein
MPLVTREQKNEYAREWYRCNKERLLLQLREKRKSEAGNRMREVNRRRNEQLRFKVLQHYSSNTPACKHCGISDLDVLNLDHIHGGGKKHQRELGGGQRLHRWIIKHNFPEIFQVLCCNCNYKKYRESLRQQFVHRTI